MIKMEQWHCFKCKEKMAEEDIGMAYLDVDAAVEGLKCPKCGVPYLLEEAVMEKVIKAEEMLENK